MDINGYRVIIIGAGVCGAITAYDLAKNGHKVLILEAGSDQLDRIKLSGNYATALDKNPGAPYRGQSPGFIIGPDNDKDYYDQQGPAKFKSTFLRIQGGSTWHFLGNVPRFIPSDFRMKELYEVGDNWPIDYDELESFYCTAEKELGVSGDHDEWNNYLGAKRTVPYPMNKIWQSYGDEAFLNNVDDQTISGKVIKIMSTPQARNSTIYDGRPACAGNSTCVPICPIQAKYDATVHVKKAINLGCVVRHNAVVKKLDKNTDQMITSIVYFDRNTNTDVTIDTNDKIVIVAAHAIETPRLLLLSGIANGSGMVGKNLMDHLQGYCVGLSKDPVYPFRGPLTTSGIDAFRDGEHRKEFGAFRLSIGNDGWGRIESPATTLWDKLNEGLLGEKLKTEVRERITRMIRISFSTEMLPDTSNSISLSTTANDPIGIPRPVIKFNFSDYNKLAMKFAFDVSKQVFALADCKTIDDKSQVNDYSGAGHIMGTTKMGTDEKTSVVNSFGRTHQHPNLYIVGPSVFVTSGTANPTLTAVALSLRTSKYIHNILTGGSCQ